MDIPRHFVLGRVQRLLTFSRLGLGASLVAFCSCYAACSSTTPRSSTASRTEARATGATTARRELPDRARFTSDAKGASLDIPEELGPSAGGPQPTPPPEEESSPPRVTALPPERERPPPPPEAIPEEKPEFVEEKPTPPPKAIPKHTPGLVEKAAPPPPSVRDLGLVKLYFATDRRWTGATEQPKWFGSEWNNATPDSLTYGTCDVSIPVTHKVPGTVEKRSIFRILIGDPEDPKRDVIVKEPQRFEKNRFFEALAGEVKKRGEKEVIVFIHGFNNTFDDAASRLGVLAYDLEFNGVPVLYSWSSRGGLLGWTPFAYWHDEHIVTSTEEALTDFLASVTQTARTAGAQRVNVVAHSMGNRPLVAALRKLAERQGDKISIDEVVMAAPDVEQREFAATYWPKLQRPGGVAKRVTLYASSEDEALIISRRLHSGFRRIGEGGDNLLCLPGLDTVDASGCDFHRFGLNHTYFGGPKIITDLAKILNPGLDPLKRKLREMKRREFGYWALPELVP